MRHLTSAEIEAGLDEVRRSPSADGRLDLIVRRPAIDQREVLAEGQLDLAVGLVGDTWKDRGSKRTDDGGPHPDMQLNIINSRFARLVGRGAERAALAGDQLHVDLDLSDSNLPPGTRLVIGDATIVVTEQPHTGCDKFSSRFGLDALRLVNSQLGKELHLRGINARVVVGGTIRRGDKICVERPT